MGLLFKSELTFNHTVMGGFTACGQYYSMPDKQQQGYIEYLKELLSDIKTNAKKD